MPIFNFPQKLFIVLLFASFICSMYPWFVWNNFLIIIVSISTFLSSAVVFFQNDFVRKRLPVFFVIILIALHLWESHFLAPHMMIISCMSAFSLVVLILQDESFKINLLHLFTKWFGILLIISSISYLLNFWGLFPISPVKIQYGNSYYSLNYYLFIMPRNIYADIYTDFYVRFRSIFMEPGHMALGAVSLIMANKFNLKNKYVLFIFFATVISFSLAAYITMGIGYLLFNFSLKKVKRIILAVIVVVVANFVMVHFGNEEIMDKYLWNRLEYSEKTGTIEGNKRTSLKYDQVYKHTLSRFDLFILGNDEYDKQNDYGGNAGYKRYIVEKGLVGVILVLLFYLYVPFSLRTKDSIIFSLIIILLLFQDAYPLWSCIIIPYILGMSCLKKVVLDDESKKNGFLLPHR